MRLHNHLRSHKRLQRLRVDDRTADGLLRSNVDGQGQRSDHGKNGKP